MASNKLLLAGAGLGGGLLYLLDPARSNGLSWPWNRKRVPNWALAARVHLEIGRRLSQPRNVQATAHSGVVTLRGTAPKPEMKRLVSAVRAIPGVSRVIKELDEPIPEAPTGESRPSAKKASSPAGSFVLGLTSGALAFSGAALLARGVTHKLAGARK